MKLSIIIVNWNAKYYLEKCLRTLRKYAPKNKYEIFVVDNASQDDSVTFVTRYFPNVRLVVNNINQGFSRACNKAIEISGAEYILLLNNDCELTDFFIDDILAFMDENPQTGIVGPILLYPNGKIQSAGEALITLHKIILQQIFFTNSPIFAKKKILTNDIFYESGFVSGACMFIRKKSLNKIGLLREDFFMYGEDVDLCIRFRKNGLGVGIYPRAHLIHHKSKSTEKELDVVLAYSVINNCILINENSGLIASNIAFLTYCIGILFRMVISPLRKGPSIRDWLKLLVKMPRVLIKINTI